MQNNVDQNNFWLITVCLNSYEYRLKSLNRFNLINFCIPTKQLQNLITPVVTQLYRVYQIKVIMAKLDL